LIPVISKSGEPLMPTSPSRARKWIKSNKATPFFKKGIFCVRLNEEPSANYKQKIAVGIDTGSKKEAFTVKSKAHTFLNIQSDTVTWVKDAIETRRMMRKSRRQRKTPCRQPRWNRASLKKNRIPPSTLARWNCKLRIVNILTKLFPISVFVVEDISAVSKKNQKKWNKSFSPLEVGKKYFYKELLKIAKLRLKKGYQTKKLRDKFGLKKSKNKLGKDFSCHCVDSWVLANNSVGGHISPENKEILYIQPLRFYRRQLHALQPAKRGIRRPYGGTKSLGFKRGSLVRHPRYGLTYVGGSSKNRISLHSLKDGRRLTRNIKQEDCKFLGYSSWKYQISSYEGNINET
jgi:RRXRR protein